MALITAILHTCNDELRLGRALQTLLSCNQILIIDHCSTDCTLRIAREYAASIRTVTEQAPADLLHFVRND